MPIFIDHLDKEHELPAGETIHWRISAYGVIINNDQEVLVVIPTWRNTYDLPGGGVEPTEQIAEGVIRECYEETGYKVKLDSEMPFYILETNFYHTDHNQFYHSVNLFYRCSLASEEQNTAYINTVEPDEIEKVEWKKITELTADNCHSHHYKAMQNLNL
jgi:8-oxo-dGTP diphosphatase